MGKIHIFQNCLKSFISVFLLQLINETRIVIVPSINPDGLELAAEKQCTSLQGMSNAHGKDLDTDFLGRLWLLAIVHCVKPACWTQIVLCVFLSPSGNASQRMVAMQPETKAMMDLILEKDFTLSVALDGGSLVATYPYDKPVQSGNDSQLMNKTGLCWTKQVLFWNH